MVIPSPANPGWHTAGRSTDELPHHHIHTPPPPVHCRSVPGDIAAPHKAAAQKNLNLDLRKKINAPVRTRVNRINLTPGGGGGATCWLVVAVAVAAAAAAAAAVAELATRAVLAAPPLPLRLPLPPPARLTTRGRKEDPAFFSLVRLGLRHPRLPAAAADTADACVDLAA